MHADPKLRGAYEDLFGPLPKLEDRTRFPERGRPVPDDTADPLQQAWSSMSAEDRLAVDRVFTNLGKVLAAFERLIVTGETPFDRYVRGLRTGVADDLAALSADARAGAKLFFGEARCHLCHHGPLLSDLEFHDVRLPGTRESGEGRGRWDGILLVQNDPFNGLGAFSDDREHARVHLAYLDRSPHTIGERKTPSLRNVATTAPYMHQGQFTDLGEVLAHYSTLADAAPRTHEDPAEVLVPIHLDEREKSQLVAFLESLTSGPVDPALSGP
jgi:cytochrome c peroxidase